MLLLAVLVVEHRVAHEELHRLYNALDVVLLHGAQLVVAEAEQEVEHALLHIHE